MSIVQVLGLDITAFLLRVVWPKTWLYYGLDPPSLTPTLVQVHCTKLSQHSNSDTVPVFETKWERLKGSVTPNLEVTLY